MSKTAATYDVTVTQYVRVVLKQEAFTEDFMAEFRESFFPFHEIKDHAEHIAQLVSQGVMEEVHGRFPASEFIEGYGPIGEFVAEAVVNDSETDVTRVSVPFAA